jgi:hypothetical protein
LMGDLLEMIGKAVHQAQEALENNALDAFWKGFTGDDELTPLAKTLVIPRSREGAGAEGYGADTGAFASPFAAVKPGDGETEGEAGLRLRRADSRVRIHEGRCR